MEVLIANDDREDLFAVIRFVEAGTKYEWAEVIYDEARGEFVLTIYAPFEGKDRFVFSLPEVQDAFARAKQRLMARGYGNVTEQDA